MPYSQACENNKSFILKVLLEEFADRRQVLEIAAGSGQHACHFAAHMSWLHWRPTDLAQNLPSLRPRCAAYVGDNMLAEKALDVRDRPWPVPVPDAMFSANSLHIMPFTAVEAFFAALTEYAGDDMVLAVYGPFNYGGEYTSPSNARFDQWLAQERPGSAIRNFEEVNRLAVEAGFGDAADYEMPANNRLLIWRKCPASVTFPERQ